MNWRAAFILLFLGAFAFAGPNEQENYYYTSPSGTYTGGYYKNHKITLKFYVPNGSYPGIYYFYWASGNSYAIINVNGSGISDHTISNPITYIWGFNGGSPINTYSQPVYTGVPMAPNGNGSQVNTLIDTLTVTLNPDTFSAPSGSNQIIDDGEQWYTASGPTTPHFAHLKIQVTNKDSKAHTIVCVVAGVVVKSQSVAAGFSGLVTVDVPMPTAPAAYDWFVDADRTNDFGGGVIMTDLNHDFDVSVPPLSIPTLTLEGPFVPSSTPANDPTKISGTGSATSGGTTASTPAKTTSVVPNSVTTVNGGSTGVTNQDIYNDIKQALADAGGGGGSTSSSVDAAVPTDSLDAKDSEKNKRGHLDDVQPAIDDAIHASESLKTGVMSKGNFAQSFAHLPQNVGTVSTLNFGTFTLAGTSHTINVDLAPWSSSINLIRAILLFVCQALFIILMIDTIYHGLTS